MTIDTFLETWIRLIGKAPNAAQRSVLEHSNGPLWVIAGPGTGKTQTLILRCLFLLCVRQVLPEAIILTTFTRKAADELEIRLQEAFLRLSAVHAGMDTIDLSRLRIGTMHSLCWTILTETPDSRFRHSQPLSALDQAFFVYTNSRFCSAPENAEQEKLFLELISWVEQKTYRKLPSRWERAHHFIAMYERLTHDQVDRFRFAKRNPAFHLLIQLIEAYETELQAHHFTDQTGLLQQTLELLQTEEGRLFVQGIQEVIVDEYQDSNPLQASLYRALADHPPHNLCVVGDDDQALYRFRGGTVGCMIRFPEECENMWPGCNMTQVSLTETYRSQSMIVHWINTYITAHPSMALPNARVNEKAPLALPSNSSPNPPAVWAIRGKTVQESARSFATVLRSLKEQGVIESYTQCALLARSIKCC